MVEGYQGGRGGGRSDVAAGADNPKAISKQAQCAASITMNDVLTLIGGCVQPVSRRRLAALDYTGLLTLQLLGRHAERRGHHRFGVSRGHVSLPSDLRPASWPTS